MPRTALVEADGPWWNVPLTSGWLIAFFAVLGVGAMVATGWTWDVERYKRVRRSALLVAIQVLTALTLGAAINVAGGFYGSLADLFGEPRDAGPVVAAGNGAGPLVAVEPWLAKARRETGPGKGVWTSLTIAGKRTGYRLPAWIYVPDAYFDPSPPDAAVPGVAPVVRVPRTTADLGAGRSSAGVAGPAHRREPGTADDLRRGDHGPDTAPGQRVRRRRGRCEGRHVHLPGRTGCDHAAPADRRRPFGVVDAGLLHGRVLRGRSRPAPSARVLGP
jgi:hypothetical protein